MWVLECVSFSFCGARDGVCGSAGADMTCGSGENIDGWLYKTRRQQVQKGCRGVVYRSVVGRGMRGLL